MDETENGISEKDLSEHYKRIENTASISEDEPVCPYCYQYITPTNDNMRPEQIIKEKCSECGREFYFNWFFLKEKRYKSWKCNKNE